MLHNLAEEDKQIKDIRKTLKDGQEFYPATRIIQGEWPRMATKGQGKGKKPISKICDNQAEWDAFMGDAKEELIEDTSQEV